MPDHRARVASLYEEHYGELSRFLVHSDGCRELPPICRANCSRAFWRTNRPPPTSATRADIREASSQE